LSLLRRLLANLDTPSALAAAIRLDTWLLNEARATGVPRIPTTRIYPYGPARVRDSRDLNAALTTLTERGRARLEKGGRRRFVTVNPVLLARARCDAARRRAHPSGVCRPAGLQPARCGALRCRRAPAPGTTAPRPYQGSTGQRTGTEQQHGAGGAQLKTAWRDGTTHIVISPLGVMQRLAALLRQ